MRHLYRASAFLILARIFSANPCQAQWVYTNGPANPGFSVLSFARYDSFLYAGTWTGVFVADMADTSWHYLSDGLPNAPVSSLAILDSSLFAGLEGGTGTRGGVFRFVRDSAKWIATDSVLLFAYTKFLLAGDSSLYAGIWGNGIYRSTNSRESWSQLTQGCRIAAYMSIV